MTFGQIVLANPVCMVLVVSQSNCFCELGLYGAGCLLVKLFLRIRFVGLIDFGFQPNVVWGDVFHGLCPWLR